MNIFKYILGDSFNVHNTRQNPFYSEGAIFLNHKLHVFNVIYNIIQSTILQNIIYTNMQCNGIYITFQVYIHIMENLFDVAPGKPLILPFPFVMNRLNSLILIPFTILSENILLLTFAKRLKVGILLLESICDLNKFLSLDITELLSFSSSQFPFLIFCNTVMFLLLCGGYTFTRHFYVLE